MTYLLDTNTCIRYLNERAPNVLQRLQTLPPTEVRVCAIVKAEMYFGAMDTRRVTLPSLGSCRRAEVVGLTPTGEQPFTYNRTRRPLIDPGVLRVYTYERWINRASFDSQLFSI